VLRDAYESEEGREGIRKPESEEADWKPSTKP
jgi:hypothetical protein